MDWVISFKFLIQSLKIKAEHFRPCRDADKCTGYFLIRWQDGLYFVDLYEMNNYLEKNRYYPHYGKQWFLLLLPSSSEQEQVNPTCSWLYFSAPLFALAHSYKSVQAAWVMLFILFFVYMFSVLKACSNNGLMILFFN